ncbi:MAG TPA: OmpH family outer membrane protein [Gammaproteobacteria bacterium]
MLKVLRALTPFALLTGLLMAAPAHAQKIGFVDAARLLQESPQFDAMMKALESEFAPRQRELLNLQQEMQQKQQTYERDRTVLSEQERTALERELRDGARELQRQAQEYEEDLQIRQNEEMAKIRNEVLQAIQAYGRDERFDLIVGDALYFDSDIDITEEILRRLNR